MIKGVIFDFDGLIVDTESVWYESYAEVLSDLYNTELQLVHFAKCIGTGNDVLIELFQQLAGESPIDFNYIEKLALQKYNEKLTNPTLRIGVEQFLKEAKQLNLKIGLASSSSEKWVKGYLDKLGVLHYFEVINTKDVVNKVKPDPELYVKTVNDLNLLPTEVIAFEDSLNGLTAAKAAGIYCVIVPNDVTRHMEFTMHDYHLHSMEEKSLSEVLNNVISKISK
ncbi:MAG: HAD family hydrolase [Bacillaceae bacterium]|nr:HAD family hydrolase [Bacillaceae bacterium]